MATSELSDRLDYLISYSSQLVFVCTDKVKQQSRVIEKFLSKQDEQTEVALLTADPLTPLAIYRETIFKQLLDNTGNEDFNRPLNQLLAPLNNQADTVLISIFQADKLPNKLVKEIWELVLQSRFANNRQHLNVLLMGCSEWAEQMKSGLASRSKEKPIILNNNNSPFPATVSLDEDKFQSLENTDLETLLLHNRERFAERIKDRNQDTYIDKPLLKKWWVLTLFSLVFMVTFAGILSWQYSDNLLKWIGAQSQTQLPNQPIKTNNIVENQEHTTKTQIMEETQLLTLPSNIDLDALLVTDWQSAVKDIKDNTDKISPQLVIPRSETEEEMIDAAELDSEIVLMKPDNEQTSLPSELLTNTEKNIDTKLLDTNEDYAVPDITTEPQKIPVEITLDSSPVPLLDNLNKIMALPSSEYVIQISALTDPETLMNYITDENLESQLWVYQVHRNQVNWYVLIHNQSFASINSATAHIQNLPAVMLKNSPFIKQVAQIQQEISTQVH